MVLYSGSSPLSGKRFGSIPSLTLLEKASKIFLASSNLLVVKHKPYYALWSYKILSSERFDLLGNSLAIRLPKAVVEVLGLKEGDSIDIHVADRRSFAIEKAATAKQLLERLRKYRGRLPAGFKFDRLQANERN